jgi:hypothetical protein
MESNLIVKVNFISILEFKNIQMNIKFMYIINQPYNSDLNYANFLVNKQINISSCIKRQLKRFNVVV